MVSKFTEGAPADGDRQIPDDRIDESMLFSRESKSKTQKKTDEKTAKTILSTSLWIKEVDKKQG